MNIDDIRKILPHRYPFLLVDRVIELNKEKGYLKALKNVTINEPFFQGHFPDYPIMPGVLIVEGLAQAAGLLMLESGNMEGKVALFLGIDRFRFKKQVRPGDSLLYTVEKTGGRGELFKFSVKAMVDDKVVAEGEIMIGLGRK